MATKYDYDVIVIGAGIGGLVCGCYLAKAGLKTLIVEKEGKVGGYCTSFTRNGFFFDACLHTLVSCRREGSVGRLIDDLEVREKMHLIRNDPSDIIITPRYKINISNNVDKTITELQKLFPLEKNHIERFFKYLWFTPVISLYELSKKSFKEMLDHYFNNKDLKNIFSLITLGATTLPPSELSAIVGCLIYKEFVLDGGYYIKGGTGKFIEVLVNRFIEFGGEVSTSTKATKIEVKNNRADGIFLDNNRYISSKYTISACDLRETYFRLIGKDIIKSDVAKKINALEPSLSAFIVYLGLKGDFKLIPELKSQIWLSTNDKDVEEIYGDILRGENNYLIINSPSNKEEHPNNDKYSLNLSLPMPFKSKEYWTEENKNNIANELLKIANRIIPHLSKCIDLQIIASPYTLYKKTLNYHGAAYGWAGTRTQFVNTDITQKTHIENLYLAGHWTNLSGGITSVVNTGKSTAKLIFTKERKKK